MVEVFKFVTLHGSLRKKRKKIFAFFCKNNSILRPFLVKFRFERPVSNSAKRAQNKRKKNWRAQAKLVDALCNYIMQRWSPRRRPRGHSFKSLASKVKFLDLASKPHFLDNCPVFGSRTALFFELLKFCTSPKKKFWKTFFSGDRLKKNFEDLFFWRTLARVFLVLGLERVCSRKSCPWPRIFFCVLGLGLEPCVLDSTSNIMGKAKK